MHSSFPRFIYLSILVAPALSRVVPARRDDPSTVVDSTQFEADSSINVAALYDYVKSNKGGSVLATYPTCSDCDTAVDSKIIDQSSAMAGVFTFLADMDVDCDGINYQCPGNPDGQPQTDFGAADTYQVPWFVLVDKFAASQGVADNALGAVICNGKMFYGIFADSNGDTPRVTGEASWLMAQSCFPGEGLTGGNGHPAADVAYIVFGKDTPDGVSKETVEYGPLKQLGDQKMAELMSKLNLSSSSGTSQVSEGTTDVTTATSSQGTTDATTATSSEGTTDVTTATNTSEMPAETSTTGDDSGDDGSSTGGSDGDDSSDSDSDTDSSDDSDSDSDDSDDKRDFDDSHRGPRHSKGNKSARYMSKGGARVGRNVQRALPKVPRAYA